MADLDQSVAEVGAIGKESLPAPAPKSEEFSNSRMRMFASSATATTPKDWAKAGESNSDGDASNTGEPATGKKADEPNSGANGTPATNGKQDSTPAPKDGDKSGEPKPAEKTPSTKINYEEEFKKHQSRADKAEAQLKTVETEWKTKFDTIETESKANRELIENFRKDPVNFIQQNLPELGQQLRQSGDAVKMIGDEVGKFKKELDTAFKKQFGEEWKFSESESITPDSASFRYKLALDLATKEAMDKQRGYVNQAQQKIEKTRQSIVDDKVKLKTEFGFTDDDFKKIDEWKDSTILNYYNVAKIALIDKIIEQKVASIVPPQRPPKDITDAGGGDHRVEESSGSLSKEAKTILGKIGLGGRR